MNTTRAWSSLLTGAALLCGCWALVSCTAGDDAGMPEYAPDSPVAAIKAVSLGTSDDKRFDHRRTGTVFPEGTDRVLVWYRWEGAAEGLRIENRWYLEGNSVLEQGESVTESAGRAAWFLLMSAGSPLPLGNYRVDLLENGVVVATIPFRVGS